MESFGEYLKNLREEKDKSLEDIAEATKIAASNLRFLEEDRYDLLPPRVFVKGFIRSYLEALELNPDEALSMFEAFTREGEVPDYYQEEHPVFGKRSEPRSAIRSSWFTIALSVAGLLSLVVLLMTGASRLLWWDEENGMVSPNVTIAEPGTGSTEQSEVSTGADSLSDTLRDALPRHAGKNTLEIRALANTWIRVEPDTGPAEELMMAPGDIQHFNAKDRFFLQTGNAGGIRLRFNGKELPPLGKADQTLSLILP
jgi:cytoskeleton protein RodZ